MALILDPKFPTWIKTECKRWYKSLALQDWEVSVNWGTDPSCDGYCEHEMQYHTAHIFLARTLRRNPYGKGVVLHEFLHLHYAPVADMVRAVLQIAKENDLSYAQIAKLGDKLLDPIIDSLIEKDVEAAGYART